MIKSRGELKQYLHIELDTNERYDRILDIIPINIGERQIIRKILKRLRYAEYYKNINSIFKNWYKFRYQMLCNKYLIHIPLNTCEKGLSIAHTGNIVINSQAKIGKNCRIHMGVNIGSNKGKAPILGDNVYIGPGAKIFGEIEIGNNIIVGANAVVNKSCLVDHAVLAGVPAKIVKIDKSEDDVHLL